ncbi:MAG: DUF2339 domain-containing protein [Actinomycetota bacterium]|nr:DUF2339 domain-containing protein [Actinomycetota bacterium]
MVEEQRVKELELRMDVLAERLDGLEASVGDRPPHRGDASERLRFEPPRPAGPAVPVQAPRAEHPVTKPPAVARWRPALPVSSRGSGKQRHPRLDDVLGGRSVEDLLGGRVLAWVGGLAVLIGVALLFAVGVSRGWIGESARTLIAGAGSAALLALGVWLHEQRGRTDAALAAVATGISALFITITVGAEVYGVLPAPVALGLALAVGALATTLAVRWEAQGIAALGILGALLSPLLGGAPSELGTMAILLIAAASAVGVLLRQRWDWLSFGVFLITMPQWVAYLGEGRPTYAVIAVLTGFGLLGAAAAVGYELRVAADTIRPSSAFLLALNAIALAAAGWLALSTEGHETVGRLWLVALAAVHLAIGLWSRRSGLTSHAFSLLALVIGAVLADVAFAAVVEGPARALGWAGAGVMFAVLIRRAGSDRCGARTIDDPAALLPRPVKDEALTALGVGVHVALALLQSITSDAPPDLLGGGGPLGLGAAIGLAGVAAGCLVSARLAEAGQRELRVALDIVGLAVVAYLTALTLDGALLTLAWSVEAVALAKLGSRTKDRVAAWGGRAHLLLALTQALAFVAPLSALVDGLAEPLPAIGALAALAVAAAACARLTSPDRPGIRRALEVSAMSIAAYLVAVALDGAALVAVLAVGAVVLAEMARRLPVELAAPGALAYLGGALAHVLVFEAPPSALVSGVDQPAAAAVALGAVVIAGIACGRPGWGPPLTRETLLGAAAVTALYLASVLVVTPFEPGNPPAEASLLELDVRQQGQVLLSALWSVAGFGALVVGLRRDLRLVRLGALALLLATVGKVFMFDLATLTSIYRVASFIGLGLFLLTAAFVWQRMRPRPPADMRAVPEGVR